MEKEDDEGSCNCFFYAMREPNPHKRHSALSRFFGKMPCQEHEEDVLVMSSLWSIAMNHPDDTELPSVGVLRCMSLLIQKGLSDPSWLHRHQNIYIPYYAAHVIGSYTISLPSLASLAVEAGVIAPLLGLFSGRMTWVEQRVAARALGHLASYDSTFPKIARHGEEILRLAMRISSTCINTVYEKFLVAKKREKYHCDLLTRGLGGVQMEDRKAEEWASQLQCWSIYLLSCFAWREKNYHSLICEDLRFLRKLCRMWGGMVNGDSPAGVGLMRILCRSEVGREAMAGCSEVIDSLCSLSRSSDDWQYMGIDCLLLLVNDPKTRPKVMSIALTCLVDLAELDSLGNRQKLGDAITKALLLDFKGKGKDKRIESLWELKVHRYQKEEAMTEEELEKQRAVSTTKKQEGNEKFWSGDIEEAIVLYTEALELCPLRRRKERLVLYSNRAQCHLLVQEVDKAVSDSTRALSLSRPANSHSKSLWRRAQAYDMKGMPKESLLDCIMFINGQFNKRKGKGSMRSKVPYYAVRMINKQMTAAGLFASAIMMSSNPVESENINPRSGETYEIQDIFMLWFSLYYLTNNG
ncbi:uncharacterized protein A4U43_C10F16300 [Asparagus officinalis]|uniref:ARM repeat N-terminal plant domain-containing protein n=1 Tax=Asparagus officinalis TaxID=4686 RepID=A0A5P1E3E2_ASPOF|nr:uncharacterized protein A4U43_C10F16300 [Asparagus officinalis]